jgi:hypothetical protein
MIVDIATAIWAVFLFLFLFLFPHIPLLEERCWSSACFYGFLQVMNEQRIFQNTSLN